MLELIIIFLLQTLAGHFLIEGLKLAWGEIFPKKSEPFTKKRFGNLIRKKIENKKLTKREQRFFEELAKLLDSNKEEFTALFEKEFRRWRATIKEDHEKVLEELDTAVARLGIFSDEIKTIVEKAIASPFELFIDLETFLERVDPELGETEHYVPRADELEILDKFLDSDKRLLLIFGDRGVGKTRLLIEYVRKLEEKGKTYRFCSKLGGTTSDREYATAIEGVGKDKGLILLIDEIEQVPNKKGLLDFLIDPSKLDINGDLKVIGCSVYKDAVKRDELGSWIEPYELNPFDIQNKREAFKEIAKRNFEDLLSEENLNWLAKESDGFPDVVIAFFHLLNEGAVSLADLPSRDKILKLRFDKLYKEAGDYRAALPILAVLRVVWEDELHHFNEFYAGHGDGTFARALNDVKLEPYVAMGVDGDGKSVRGFRSRELFAIYLMKKFFFDNQSKGNLTNLARLVAKTKSATFFLNRILIFQEVESCKEKCDRSIDSLLEVIQQPDSHSLSLFDVLVILSERYTRRGILRASVNWSRLMERFQKLADSSLKPTWGNRIAIILSKFGELSKSSDWYEESLTVARRINDEIAEADILHGQGILAENQGHFAKAKKLHEKSLDIYEKVGDRARISGALHQLGNLAYFQGFHRKDFKEAYRIYNKCLSLRRELNDKKGVAGALHQLGMVAQAEGDFIKANSLYHESLEIAITLANIPLMIANFHQLGELSIISEDAERAYKFFEQCLDFSKKIGDAKGVAKSLFKLGELAYNWGNYVEARSKFLESLEIANKMEDRLGVATIVAQLGDLSEHEKNDKEAFIDYFVALNIFVELDSEEQQFVIAKIARLRERVGQEEFERLVKQAGEKLGQDLSFVLKWFEEEQGVRPS